MTNKLREDELYTVCPFPVDFDRDTFQIQIKSADGRATQWLDITGEEFNLIENILVNGAGQ